MPIRLLRLLPASMFLSVALLPAQSPAQENQKPYYLHDHDTVLFYGDSITEQRYYTQFVDLYTATRFPKMHVTFYNAGIGGDRVSGGAGGPIDLRLSRDVFPQKPTVVTIMLGMNDGSYQPLTPAIESTYTLGFEHILDSIHKTLPNARISLFGPSPYDEVTRPEMFPGGYNTTLTHFSELDSKLAKEHGATYVDLNAPFVAALKRGAAIMPTATQILLPDRVHPEQLAHWFMADAILKGWNAPSLVSAVAVDAAQKKVVEQQNTAVTGLTATGTSLSWTQLDGSLPLPIDMKHAGYQFLLQLCDIIGDLDRQPLTVTGLKPGNYQLSIDDSPIAQLTDLELAKGINLAEYNTPMRGQAYRVGWLIRDRDDTHYVRLHMFMAERDLGSSVTRAEPAASELTEFEQVQQGQIETAAQPKPHTFTLKAIEAAK